MEPLWVQLAWDTGPAALQCFTTTAGQADYLLQGLVAGVDELDILLRPEISQLPGVQRLATTVCLRTIKHRGRVSNCLRYTTVSGVTNFRPLV